MRRTWCAVVGGLLWSLVLAGSASGRRIEMYWANTNGNTISVANLDGSGSGSDLNTIGATVTSPQGVAVDPAHNRIYWANAGLNRISVANLDGSGSGSNLNWGLRPQPPYARHDQQLGGASPLWRLMAPTTSRRQLRRREAGWEGSPRRSRDPRNTWSIG